MDINSILKAGGKVDVLIRTKTAQKIGDINLIENEPYTFINNVAINFLSSQEGVRSKADGTILSYNNMLANQVHLYNVPLTEKICNLVFQNRKILNKTYKTLLVANNNTLILHHQEAYNIFVYDLNNNLIGVSDYVSDGIITSDKIINNQKYLVFYEYIINNNIDNKMYNLQSPDRSYFTLDIFGKGNQDNLSSDVFIKIDTCVLITNNNLIFNNGLNSLDLTFDIIQMKNNQNKNYLIVE